MVIQEEDLKFREGLHKGVYEIKNINILFQNGITTLLSL